MDARFVREGIPANDRFIALHFQSVILLSKRLVGTSVAYDAVVHLNIS